MHQAQKPSCSHQAGSGPERAGTGVRTAEGLGNGGVFIMCLFSDLDEEIRSNESALSSTVPIPLLFYL